MICPQCRTENDAQSSSCLKCGSSFDLVLDADRTMDSHDTPSAVSGTPSVPRSASAASAAPAVASASAGSRTGARSSMSVFGVFEPGDELGHRYRIEHLLGQGGMGRVYKAYDKELERMIALKVLQPELVSDPNAMQRFKQELLLASRISHKNILRIHDLGEADSVKFISMAFVEGEDLHHLLRTHGRLPVDRAGKIAEQLCEALDAAHSEGVVHRDLKPQNILMGKNDQVYVVDFGLAKSLEASAAGMTRTGQYLGTPRYMAPEQVEAKPADNRTDLYALGLIIFEMLTGEDPFKGESTVQTMYRRVKEKPPNPKDLNPEIPEYLARIILRCMERDPARRYQSARDILADLQAAHAPSRAKTMQISLPALERKGWLIAGGTAAAILLIVALAILRGKVFSPSSNSRTSPGPQVSLAILPFRNASSDQTLDWLGGSLAEMLRTDVGESSNFHTVSSDRLHQILSDLRISGETEIDPATLRRVAEFTGADQLVWGQYVKLGGVIRIDATLEDVKAQKTTALKVDARDENALLQTVDQLARTIQNNLSLAPSAVREMEAAAFTPSSQSVEALRDYSQGLDLARQANQLEAVKKFEAATAADPNFALAYSMLGQGYATLGYDKEAEQYSSKALDLSASLPPAEKYMIQAADARIENNYDKAVEAYGNLIKLMPNDPQVQFEVGSLYDSHGAFDQARDHYLKALQSDPKYVDALLAVGMVEIKSSNSQGSLDYLNRALSLAVELNNQQGKANVLQAIGDAYDKLNRPGDALQNYQQSLEIKKQIGDKKGMAKALNMMAQIYEDTAKPKDAEQAYRQALKLYQEIGSQAGAGTVMMDLGSFLEDNDRHSEALDLTKQALQTELQTGDLNSQSICLNNIANIYLNQGRYEDALTYFQQALDLAQKIKVPWILTMTSNNLGETYRKMGQYDQATNNYLRALEVARNAGDKFGVAETSDSMAELFEIQGRYGAAVNAEQDAFKNIQEAQTQNAYKAGIESNYGNALTLIGRFDEAQKRLDNALNLARSLHDDSRIAMILNFQGERFYYQGDFKSARPLFEQALQAATRGKDREQTLNSKLNLAKLSVVDGHAAVAASNLRALAKDADLMGEMYVSMECSLYTGEALVGSKNYSQARQELETLIRKSGNSGLKSLLPQAHYWLAMALRGMGNKSEAADHLQQAAQILEEMRKESNSDDLLKRQDLKPIIEEKH
jgi:eukaryotic-like serine/threonine-protein kinase